MGRFVRTGAIPHRQYVRRTRPERVRHSDSVFGDFLTRNALRLFTNKLGIVANLQKLGEFFPKEIEALDGPRDGAKAYSALPGPGTTVTSLGALVRITNATATFLADGFEENDFAILRITSARLGGEVLLYAGLIQPPLSDTEMNVFIVPSAPYQGSFDGLEGSTLEVLVQ